MRKLKISTALLVAALGTGCTRTEETPPATPPASPAVRSSALQEELARLPPRVEELFITPYDALSSSTPTLLEVRFVDGTDLPQVIDIFPSDFQQTTLRDDGQDGDLSSGDGIYSAMLDFDFEELILTDQLVDQLQGELGDEARVPLVSGRSVVEQREPFRLDLEMLSRPFERFQIPFANGISAAISKEHSLLINMVGMEDLERIPDPCLPQAGDADKKWAFGYLMREMAGPRDPSEFTREWLLQLKEEQFVNGWSVQGRPDVERLLAQWENLSGGETLDMDMAPFRLLSIVNRLDLAESSFYGGTGAGEGRFVFAWVDDSCQTQEFTVIFEYLIPVQGCFALKDWARQWKELDEHEVGTPDYNAKLELITEQFAKKDAMPERPNGSALNQLRTNEIALGGGEQWEQREFKIDGDGRLTQVPVAQTPDITHHNTNLLRDYVNDREFAILLERNVVPAMFDSTDFLGGSSLNPFNFFWRATGIHNNETRHHFSLNTCNGCHSGETGTDFTHIDVQTGAPSRFLTGTGWPTASGLPDPEQARINASGGPAVSSFYTYGDLDRRAANMDDLIRNPCSFRIFNVPILGH
ncbi:choice-of-anchor X domain-containing protein [Pyxidicoccus trucidator]|uniref:choice-of-anchor X domain-containing protein n=1 Tax=Pyxidicoccus trucidator TaxID=2709662 RepID=UPI0013DA5D41|nr:choice-of-anchor X domain-containing protein [Pyxidicoccus trucidator]